LTNAYRPPSYDAPALAKARTDAEGVAVVRLDHEIAFLEVTKDGFGTSGMQSRWHENAQGEVLVTLRRDARLRGVVLRAAGSAAAGVRVEPEPSGQSSLFAGQPRRPQPVTTDPLGRFELPVPALCSFRLRARDGALASLDADVHAR